MKVVKNDGPKYSEFLNKILEKFDSRFTDDMDINLKVQFIMHCWNLAKIKEHVPIKEFSTLIAQSFDFSNREKKLLMDISQHVEENYSDYPNFFQNFEIKFNEKGKLLLKVQTLRGEDYMSNMLQQPDFIQEYLPDFMDDLDDEFETGDYEENFIDRNSVLIEHKQPMLEWIATFGHETDDIYSEPTLYLFHENHDDFEFWLKSNHKKIFQLELENWNTSKSTWPKRFTLKMFHDWFSVRFIPICYDLEKHPVRKY